MLFQSLNSSELTWFKGSCFLGVLHLLGSYLLCTASSTGITYFQREWFGKTSYLGLSVPKFLTLHTVWLWVSIFVPICSMRKPLWWWLSKALIHEEGRISLGVTLSLNYFTSSVWFYPRTLCYLVCNSWSLKQCQIWAPSHGVDFKYNQILVGCFTSIVLHCPSIYYRQNTIVDQRVCGYIGFFHRSSPHYPLSFSFKKGKPLLCITSAPLCASTHCKTIACKFHYDIFNV